MEQMYPLYTNKDKEHEHFFSRRKKREKVRLTSEEDLKQKGDQKETLPSGFRGIIFFFGKKARVLLFLNFKLIEMGSFSISFLGRNGNC